MQNGKPRTAGVVVVGLIASALAGAAPAWGDGWAGSRPVSLTSDDTPFVAASAGSAVAAWLNELDPVEGTSTLTLSARGPGQTPPLATLPVSGDAADTPSLASNDSGTIAVGWASTDSGGDTDVNLRVFRNGASTGSVIVDASDAGADAVEAEVAVAPDGSVLLAWIAPDTTTVVRAVVRRPDGTVTPTFDLASTPDDVSELDAAGDGTGFIATFVRTDSDTNTAIDVVRTPLGGTTHTSAPPLATGAVDSSGDGFTLASPVLVAGGGRAAIVFSRAFQDASNDTVAVEGAIGTVAGGITAPAVLSVGQAEAQLPSAAAGPDGTIAVAWTDADSSTTSLRVAAPGQPFGAIEPLGGAATRYDLGVLPDGSVLAGVATNQLDGRLRPPGGTGGAPIPSVGVANTGPIDGGTVAADGIGHVVAAYAGQGAGAVSLNAYDTIGPRLGDVDAPDSGRVGQRLEFGTSGARDDWSTTGTPKWTFGDGGEATGADVSHTYARSGRFGLGLTLTDGLGNEAVYNAGTVAVSEADGTPPPPGPVIGAPVTTRAPASGPPSAGDRTAPVLGRLKLSRSVFRVASGSTAFAAGTSIRSGAEARFRTLEPGLVRVVISRMADAAGMQSRCAAAGLPLRSKSGGARRVKFERILSPGTHRIRLTGRAGGKALPRGRYELRVSVADEAGNRSKAQVARFTLC